MSDLHPISLCNVIYKCVSKVLVNGLWKVLDSVIFESQSAFILGRSITDNAMVGFECLHSMHRKVNRKKGFMALKLDTAKAYDRVEWCFLEGMMRCLGFSESWISKVMDCVSIVHYSFILNGNVMGDIMSH